ncbi:MAG: lipoate protein ligase C-terminal domain-containing protein [Candidatus Thorarchaeota archaeon]|jgi:lipoate-protein ligase A
MELLEVVVMLNSSYKIPGGKPVKVKLWVESEKIERITILGDFFLHPEETIQEIESTLAGVKLNSTSIESIITKVIVKSDAKLIGASPEDFVTAIMMAWDSKQELLN